MEHNGDYAASNQRLDPKIGGGKQLLIWVSTILLFILAFLGWMSIISTLFLWAAETFGMSRDWDWMDITHLVLTILGVVGAVVGTIMVGRAWQKALKYRVLRSVVT